MSGGERRPSRDTAPIAAVFAAILVGPFVVTYLSSGPPDSLAYGRWRVLVGVLAVVSVLVVLVAAVVSFLSYLAWYSGRPVKLAPSVHLGAGAAAAVSAVLVVTFGLSWMLSARASAEVFSGLVALVGGLSMGVVAVDVIRSR